MTIMWIFLASMCKVHIVCNTFNINSKNLSFSVLQVGPICALFALISASYGMDTVHFRFNLNAIEIEPQYVGAAASLSPRFLRSYETFAADCVQLIAASSDHCVGIEVFHSAHVVLQDYLLRHGGEEEAGGGGNIKATSDPPSSRASSIIASLRSILEGVVAMARSSRLLHTAEPMAGALSYLLTAYGDYYSTGRENPAFVSLLHSVPSL